MDLQDQEFEHVLDQIEHEDWEERTRQLEKPPYAPPPQPQTPGILKVIGFCFLLLCVMSTVNHGCDGPRSTYNEDPRGR